MRRESTDVLETKEFCGGRINALLEAQDALAMQGH